MQSRGQGPACIPPAGGCAAVSFIYQEHHHELTFRSGRPVSCCGCRYRSRACRLRRAAVPGVYGEEVQRTERDQVRSLQGQMRRVRDQGRRSLQRSVATVGCRRTAGELAGRPRSKAGLSGATVAVAEPGVSIPSPAVSMRLVRQTGAVLPANGQEGAAPAPNPKPPDGARPVLECIMFKLLCITALVSVLAACSTLPGSTRASNTATMGAPGAPLQNAIGPHGNGP